jgi:hypothetical protein
MFASEGRRVHSLRRKRGLLDGHAYQEFRQSFLGDLRSELAAGSCTTVCLSNEHLSSRLRQPEEIAFLAAALTSLAPTVKVIVYLRPQHELFLSAYSTKIKSGGIHGIKPPDDDANLFYNYDLMLSPWASAFGEGNMIVRIFDRRRFPGGNVVRDFLSVIGVEWDDRMEMPADLNKSLDAHTLEFLRLFNGIIPRYTEDLPNAERADIANALLAAAIGPKLSVPADTLRRVAGIFEPSNARVARRFLNRADGVLFDGLEFRETEPAPPLTVEKVIEIAAHLWCWKQRQVNRTRSKLSRLKRRSEK